MRQQTVTFTALPNGVASNGNLRLSALVSPFLTSDDGGPVALSAFPDWLDWPARPLTFEVQFGTGSLVAATRVGPAPRSDLWRALFKDGADVQPALLATQKTGVTAAAISEVILQSYDTRAIHGWLKDVYAHIATASPEEFPTARELLIEGSPFRLLARQFMIEVGEETGFSWQDYLHPEDDEEGSDAAKPAAPLLAPAGSLTGEEETYEAFSRVKSFLAPFSKERAPRPSVEDIRFDVHQVMAALTHYPVLARMLGLVHDLEVASPGPADDTTVQVIASWPSTDPDVTTVIVPTGELGAPRLETRCTIEAGRFFALTRIDDPELATDGSRMLPLEDKGRYELVQIDQDGAAMKAFRFAGALAQAIPKQTEGSSERFSLPSLNSVGLAVARVGRSSVVESAMVTASTKNEAVLTGQDVTLDAEDLTRGYAIDVWDSSSREWRSLCERVGTYAFSDPKKPVTLSDVADEGWTSTTLTKPAEDAVAGHPKLPETIFQWFGWSLAAPRPGKTVDTDGNLAVLQNEAGPQWPFAANFRAAPGSLPRLRFGTGYKLRARAVDLAGNRVSRADAGDDHETDEVIYGRFDPVTSPEVVPQAPLTEGESTNHLVIRSNFDVASQAPTNRHTFPPKAAEPMVEAHGVFDKASGVIDSSGYGTIQSRDGVTFTTVGKADPNTPGSVYIGGTSASTPYLPDLLARGVVLRGLPGATGPTRVSFGYSEGVAWPNPKPFLIQLREGSGPPTFDNGKRLLTIRLPKAETGSARVSSYLLDDKGDVDRLGLLGWLEELGADDDTIDAFREQAAAGTHWMVAPWRTLTFVHAVRQPLLRPRFVGLPPIPPRGLGDTFVQLTDETMEVSRKSTVTLDIVARWSETLDPLGEPGPVTIQGNARPFQFPVPLAPTPAEDTVLEVTGRHEFGDTKHRMVDYTAVGTSRFAEYFAERRRGVMLTGPLVLKSPVTYDGENLGGVVAGSDAVTASDGSRAFVRGTDYRIDYATGTITPEAPIAGVAVDIAFTAPPITRRTAAPRRLEIQSTRRPDAPKVLYAIPTFGWSSSVNRDTTRFESARLGMGLRVYLDRPWFSSGDGERLGVVIWSGTMAPSEAQGAFVTDWGLDPLFESAAMADRPTLDEFPLADASRTTDLSLEELPSTSTLHVAGHKVEYDPTRRLWFSDLVIEAGPTYQPFVRLALARFQPSSVTGAHLSRVIRADYLQLAPDRAVTITRPKNTSRTVAVAVAGRGYTKAAGAAGRSVVEVSLERKRANTDLASAQELGWEPVPGQPVPLVPTEDADGVTTWRENVTLPTGPAGSFRIVITELESIGGRRRPVFADAIVI